MDEPTKFNYWWHSHISMPIDEWLCKRGYHQLNWESGDGYWHCQCGDAIQNDDEQLYNRLNSMD